MSEIRVPAFAKVNLRLDVLARRADGYHELRTIFQSISLHDTVRIERSRKRGIELQISGDASLARGSPEDNLVWKAADSFCRALKTGPAFRITLDKRIPVGRGLGGGSSDAAAALAGLLRLTKKKIAPEKLLEVAARLGADVPFFLLGGRALGTSRGDEIYPLPEGNKRTVVVVSPRDIAVSTRDAYGWIDAALTKNSHNNRLWSFCALCWSPQEDHLSNDFEAVVFERHPRLAAIRRALLQGGAAEAALAGSGSAVFGLFPNPAQARRSARLFPEDQVFLCKTISRRAYGRALWGAVWDSAESGPRRIRSARG
jgi:4-diphosphocytidyl-2-C-methyl-D-erythritol kinase